MWWLYRYDCSLVVCVADARETVYKAKISLTHLPPSNMITATFAKVRHVFTPRFAFIVLFLLCWTYSHAGDAGAVPNAKRGDTRHHS